MRIYKILTLAIFATFMISSCDVIDKPYEQNDGPIVSDTGVVRKILLEDFTAFRCPNCPAAAVKIKELHNLYGDRVIPVAIHCGSLSFPEGGKYNFRSTDGKKIDEYFGISAAGLPKGMINRTGEPSKQHILNIDEWAGIITDFLPKKADMKIEITPSNDAANIGAEINIEYLNDTEGEHQLAVILVQDSIIDFQISGAIEIPDYVHNHVYRAAFNTAWGEKLNPDAPAINKGTKYKKSYSLPIKADAVHPWEPKHLKIIAYVYKADTYEVLQAEEVHVSK